MLMIVRVDPKLHEAGGQQIKKFFQRLGGNLFRAVIVYIERDAPSVFGVLLKFKGATTLFYSPNVAGFSSPLRC